MAVVIAKLTRKVSEVITCDSDAKRECTLVQAETLAIHHSAAFGVWCFLWTPQLWPIIIIIMSLY